MKRIAAISDARLGFEALFAKGSATVGDDPFALYYRDPAGRQIEELHDEFDLALARWAGIVKAYAIDVLKTDRLELEKQDVWLPYTNSEAVIIHDTYVIAQLLASEVPQTRGPEMMIWDVSVNFTATKEMITRKIVPKPLWSGDPGETGIQYVVVEPRLMDDQLKIEWGGVIKGYLKAIQH